MQPDNFHKEDMIRYYNELSKISHSNKSETKNKIKLGIEGWVKTNDLNDLFDEYFKFIEYGAKHNNKSYFNFVPLKMDRHKTRDFFTAIKHNDLLPTDENLKFYIIMRHLQSNETIASVMENEILNGYKYYYPDKKNVNNFLKDLEIKEEDGDAEIKLAMMTKVNSMNDKITIDEQEFYFYTCALQGLTVCEYPTDTDKKELNKTELKNFINTEEYQILRSYKIHEGKNELVFKDMQEYVKGIPTMITQLQNTDNITKLGLGIGALGAAYIGYKWLKGKSAKKVDKHSIVMASSKDEKPSTLVASSSNNKKTPRRSRAKKSSNRKKSSKLRGGRRNR